LSIEKIELLLIKIYSTAQGCGGNHHPAGNENPHLTVGIFVYICIVPATDLKLSPVTRQAIIPQSFDAGFLLSSHREKALPYVRGLK